MKKCIAVFGSLFLLHSGVAQAGIQSVCNGTLLVQGASPDGTQNRAAVQVKFTLDMKDDGTATMLLENSMTPPLKGTGKESGNEDAPWNLAAQDAEGNVFKGKLEPVKPLFPQDTNMHIVLTLEGGSITMGGPMTCEMK
ncbi:MAG: hypothetical protein VX278_12630 [Myxococcota bacterium]|nr:hypothetical protein [Myxococcota bacterium]